MAKNKAKAQPEEELIGQDEVVYEEEQGGSSKASGDKQSIFQKYRTVFILGGVGAVVAGIFLVLRMGNNEEQNKIGQAAMVPALVAFEKDSMNLALNGAAGQGGGFIDLSEDYSGTDAGQLSKYYAGIAYLNTGKTDEGMALLEEYKKGSTFVGAAAYAAIAYGHEQKGEFAEAAEAYETASRTPSENAVSTPFYLMNAARNHESAGNNEAALENYRDIKSKYPLSTEGATVDKYIARLSAEDEE